MKLPRDFGRKVLKSFDFASYWHEIVSVREYVKMPLLLLLGGTILAIVLREVGVWSMVDQYAASFHSLLRVNSHMIFLAFLPFFYLSRLAQEFFMSRAKSTKSSDSYWLYFFRYIKGMVGLVTLPMMVAVGVLTGVFAFIYSPFMSLFAAPKTVFNALMLGGLGFIGLCGIAFYIVATIIGLGLSLYSFALMLQGAGFRDAVVRGLKLFSAYWIYPLCLATVFMVIPLIIRMILPFIPSVVNSAFYNNRFIADIGMYVSQVSGLVYYVLFFAYYKRVSKVPTSR